MVLKNYTFVILFLLLLVSCSQEVSDMGADMPINDIQPQEENYVSPTKNIQTENVDLGINVYSNLPDYENLEVVEEWVFETDISNEFDIAGRGNIKGAIEVLEFNNEIFMYLKLTNDGVNLLNTNDGINFEVGPVVIDSDDDYTYSHPYGITAPDGELLLFLQANPREGSEFHISLARSNDGFNFSTAETFLESTDFNIPGLDEGECRSVAHGRIAQLEDEKYLITFSASCQTENYPSLLSNRFIPGTVIAYSEDLENWNFEDSVYLPACHDPTIDTSQDKVSIYCASENLLLPGNEEDLWDSHLYGFIIRYDSDDGYDFNPSEPAGLVEFYNSDGERMPRGSMRMADIDIHEFDDGIMRLYGAVDSDNGPSVYSFTRMD